MKLIQNTRKDSESGYLVRACRNSCETILDAVAQAKEEIFRDHANLMEEHGRLLDLALNEAEALAWQTDHPHLFFPALAAEKAQGVVSWHQRQRAVLGSQREVAFAE